MLHQHYKKAEIWIVFKIRRNQIPRYQHHFHCVYTENNEGIFAQITSEFHHGILNTVQLQKKGKQYCSDQAVNQHTTNPNTQALSDMPSR